MLARWMWVLRSKSIVGFENLNHLDHVGECLVVLNGMFGLTLSFAGVQDGQHRTRST